MSDWQPIETAPKDWTVVLIFAHAMPASHDGGLEIAYWSDCFGADRPCWIRPSGGMVDHFRPTHWMPLPEPPK